MRSLFTSWRVKTGSVTEITYQSYQSLYQLASSLQLTGRYPARALGLMGYRRDARVTAQHTSEPDGRLVAGSRVKLEL